MVTSVLKLGRSTPAPATSLDVAEMDAHSSNHSRPASALASLAKRSISASGLSRRPSTPETTQMTERTKSHAPLERSASAASPPKTPLTAPAAPKTLMSSLLSGHTRTASPSVNSAPPSPALPSSTPANVPSQDEASYISKVSVKLHEMVNRIFPAAGTVDSHGAVIYKGRCSARPDRARDLGELILHEIQQAAANDQYLLRVLLRSAILRTLSVFLTRLEALMVVSVSSEASASWIPKSSRDLVPPLDKRFDFDTVKTAYELKAALISTCAPPTIPAFAKDALYTWVGNLEAIMNKIMNPFLNDIKKEVAVIVGRAHSTFERVPSGQSLATAGKHAPATNGIEGPPFLQELAGVLDGTKKFLISTLVCGKEDTDRWIVSIATHLTWKGMLAFSARPCPVDDLELNRSGTAFTAQRPVKKSSILGPKPGKRSPSPPAGSHGRKDAASRLVDDITAFRTLVIHFTQEVLHDLVRPHTTAAKRAMIAAQTVQELCDAFDLLPELDAGEDYMSLTQEAMHEAMLALSSFELSVRALRWPDELKIAFLYDDEDSSSSSSDDEANSKRLTPSAVFNLIGPSSPASRVAAERARPTPRPSRLVPIKLPCQTLDRALETMPPLITFHLLVSRLPIARNVAFRLPHEIWQLPNGWEDYVAQLTGFAAGESFAEEVGWQMVAELDRLKSEGAEGVWEDLLRVAVEAEVGIQQATA